MILILIRHGAAQRQTEHGSDAERPLTDKGRARFAQAAAGLSLLLPANVRIVSSSKLRAVQTSEILAENMGEKAVEKNETLINGNLQLFLDIRQSPGIWVAAVGHEPFAGIWRAKISGTVKRPFGIGAAAILDVERNGTGRLICDIGQGQAVRLAKENCSFPHEHLARFLHLRRIILSGNAVDEDIHQLRANIRRVRVTLLLGSKYLPRKQYANVTKCLKQLLDATANSREYAVLSQMLRMSGQNTCNLDKFLEEAQKNATAGLISMLSSNDVYVAIAEAFGLLETIRKRKKAALPAIGHCRGLIRKIKRLIKEMDAGNQETLHAIRVSIRKLCDAAIVFPQIRHAVGNNIIDKADIMQAILGRWHDLYRSRLLLQEISANKPGDEKREAENAIIAITSACMPGDIIKPLKKLRKKLHAALERQ